MTECVDVAVIGAGGAGYPGAFLLGRAGRRVLMVDPIGNLGGDCLAEGCVPSKAVREVAQAFQRARRGPLARLIGVRDPREEDVDRTAHWREVLAHKDAVQQSRYAQHTGEIAASSVEFVRGLARILDEKTIELEAEDGRRQVEFGHLILGSGSAPSRLPIPGAELAVTSHDFFRLGADLPFPACPVIIGGGYIGVELASMLEHLGAKPVVLELTDQLLPGFDADLAAFLERKLGARADVRLGARVTAIETSGSEFTVRYRTRGSQTDSLATGDLVVMATGRVPVLPDGVDTLSLEREGSGAPVVDSRLATSRPSVWAPGDVNGKSMLFHSAIRQSTVVAHNILAGGGPADRMNFSGVPFTVFTDPEIASIGLTESEASAQVDEVAIGTYDYATDSRAQIFDETDGYLKLVFDGHTGRLLGAQLAGLDAAQLAAPLALAVHAGAGARQLAEAAFPHPMVSEGINKAARSVLA